MTSQNNYKIKQIISKIYFLLLLLFISSVNINATKFHINSDIGIFYTADGNYNIEFYYSYADNNYTLNSVSTELYYGNIEFNLVIDSVNGNKNIFNDKWQVPFEYNKDTSNYIPQDLYGIRKITIANGKYLMKVTITDLNDTNRKEIKEFKIDNLYNKNKLQISTIQIANKLVLKTISRIVDSTNKLSKAQNTPSELFYKNQHYVYPNPLREISSESPTLYLYSEIYNTKSLSPDGLQITYTIRDAKNTTIMHYDKKKKTIADAIVETIFIPLDAIPTGVYTIEMLIYSINNDISAVRTNNFYLINNNIVQDTEIYYTEDELFEMSEFATYTNEKADTEFEKFKILATKSEVSTYEKLSEIKAKQRFLYRFWLFRNPNPDNPFNTELATFRERLTYVNTYFSYGGNINGWKSDRGKIYLQYGEPDHREQNKATSEKKANEIWIYSSIGGGAQFCFIDIMGLENYRLVHSDLPGYIQNYNWENLLNSR